MKKSICYVCESIENPKLSVIYFHGFVSSYALGLERKHKIGLYFHTNENDRK